MLQKIKTTFTEASDWQYQCLFCSPDREREREKKRNDTNRILPGSVCAVECSFHSRIHLRKMQQFSFGIWFGRVCTYILSQKYQMIVLVTVWTDDGAVREPKLLLTQFHRAIYLLRGKVICWNIEDCEKVKFNLRRCHFRYKQKKKEEKSVRAS